MYGSDVKRNQSENYPIFAARMGNFADMCIECEDPRPIATILYHLTSVVISGNGFLKSFVGLLFFFCAWGSHERSWRLMARFWVVDSRPYRGEIGQNNSQ